MGCFGRGSETCKPKMRCRTRSSTGSSFRSHSTSPRTQVSLRDIQNHTQNFAFLLSMLKTVFNQEIISTIRHFYVPPKSATELVACHPVGAAADVDAGADEVLISGSGFRPSPLGNPSTGSSPAT